MTAPAHRTLFHQPGQPCPRAFRGQADCPITYPAGSLAARETGCVTPGTEGGPLDRRAHRTATIRAYCTSCERPIADGDIFVIVNYMIGVYERGAITVKGDSELALCCTNCVPSPDQVAAACQAAGLPGF